MKTFVIRLIFLFALVVGLQFAYYFLFVGEKKCYPPVARQVMDAVSQKTDILFFGDSVMFISAIGEKNQTTIPDFLKNLVPQKKVTAIYRPVFDMDVYAAVCQYIIHHRVEFPEKIIIPINLRTFSIFWMTVPSWQYKKEKFIWAHDSFMVRAFFKPMDVLRFFYSSEVKQKYFISKLKAVNCFAHYSYDLKNDNEKLVSLISLARLLKTRKTKVIFYLTPINYMEGQQCGGAPVMDKVRSNILLISSTLKKEGYDLMDLSETLPSSVFVTDEHLNASGRKFVAQKIFERLQD